jgi:hypothetical protein
VGYTNAHGWGCGSGNRRGLPERDERSLEGVLPQEGDKEESDIVVAKGRDFWIESEGKIAHASMAALAIVG